MAKVELVYVAQNKTCIHCNLELEQGATVADAIRESGIWISHPETQAMAVGIYSRQVALDTVLKSGDRVEIYRPLTVDPKERRRQKAVKKRK